MAEIACFAPCALANCMTAFPTEPPIADDLTPAKDEGRRGWRAILIYGALIGVEDATYLAVDDEASVWQRSRSVSVSQTKASSVFTSSGSSASHRGNFGPPQKSP